MDKGDLGHVHNLPCAHFFPRGDTWFQQTQTSRAVTSSQEDGMYPFLSSSPCCHPLLFSLFHIPYFCSLSLLKTKKNVQSEVVQAVPRILPTADVRA